MRIDKVIFQKIIFCLLFLLSSNLALNPNNVCTFSANGSLFSMTALNKVSSGIDYQITIDNNTAVIFDFCVPFLPKQCPNTTSKSFSFLVTNGTDSQNNTITTCEPYSSDSQTSNFQPVYQKIDGVSVIQLRLSVGSNDTYRVTQIELYCTNDQQLKNIKLKSRNSSYLEIRGQTVYGCPIFELSSIWQAISDNSFIFGIILFVIGFILLFYGVLMIHLTVFLVSYFVSFIVLASITTAFLSPDSSKLAIYFTLLIILFLSTLIAYGLAKMVNFSIFLIGAFFGFIAGALLNTAFCKLTGIYSNYSLYAFQVLLIIPFGLLSFKYSNEIIILSTSLTGAYMVVRPISWIFGGFPNEWTLAKLIQNNQLITLPWTFFIYFVAIITLMILGSMYQLLKLKRRDPNEHVEQNFITQNVQVHLDKMKEAVDAIVAKFAPTQQDQQYKKIVQKTQNNENKQIPLNDLSGEFKRKSKDNKLDKKQQNF